MQLKFCFFSLLVALAFKGNAQRSQTFRIQYEIASSALLGHDDLAGAAGYDNKNSSAFGLGYTRSLSPKVSLETGITFFTTTVEITPAFTGTPVSIRQEELQLVSLPLYVNYAMGKYFYVHGGPSLVFQKQEASFDSQAGIGYGLGFGVKLSRNSVFLFLNPNFKRHAVVPFKKERHPQKLTQFGVQLGIGYVF